MSLNPNSKVITQNTMTIKLFFDAIGGEQDF